MISSLRNISTQYTSLQHVLFTVVTPTHTVLLMVKVMKSFLTACAVFSHHIFTFLLFLLFFFLSTPAGTISGGAAAAGTSRLRDVVRPSAGVSGVLVTGDACG